MRKKPQPKEHEVQAAIVDALRLAGLTVYETTAYRQKGASGVDRGIPDLLVCCPARHFTYLGLEVKVPEGWRWSSIEQQNAAKLNHFAVVTSPSLALRHAYEWLEQVDGCGVHTRRKIEALLEALGEAA